VRKKTEIRGKNVLITGGAMGMGRSLAELFLEEGAAVAIVDVRADELERTREELASRGRIAAYMCDVSDREKIAQMAETVEREFGPIDILVNVAGIVNSRPFLEKSDAMIERTVGVNLMAIFWTIRAFLPGMMQRGQGHVVNFASAGGLLGVPYISDYCATKFAVVGLTESLRQEMKLAGHRGIHFSHVCPNTVSTGMFEGASPVKGTRMLTAEDVTRKVIAGIKDNRAMIGVPSSVYFLPVIKVILPPFVMDFVCRLLGIAQSSQHMTGRKDAYNR